MNVPIYFILLICISNLLIIDSIPEIQQLVFRHTSASTNEAFPLRNAQWHSP
jgi:hypothetical protein